MKYSGRGSPEELWRHQVARMWWFPGSSGMLERKLSTSPGKRENTNKQKTKYTNKKNRKENFIRKYYQTFNFFVCVFCWIFINLFQVYFLTRVLTVFCVVGVARAQGVAPSSSVKQEGHQQNYVTLWLCVTLSAPPPSFTTGSLFKAHNPCLKTNTSRIPDHLSK